MCALNSLNYHLTLQDTAFGNGIENAPIKQEPLKYNKSNKAESSKPKNTASASRQSDRKEKSSVPRNSNKQAAWKWILIQREFLKKTLSKIIRPTLNANQCIVIFLATGQ